MVMPRNGLSSDARSFQSIPRLAAPADPIMQPASKQLNTSSRNRKHVLMIISATGYFMRV
jgi:hypothetical protein